MASRQDPPRTGLGIGGAHVVWALLLAATLPWRTGTYFDGGLDSVVVAKALISLLGLAIAFHLGSRTFHLTSVPAAPIVILAAYLGVTVVGGYAHGTLMPALVVAVRVAILLTAIVLLVTRYTTWQTMRALVHVFGVIAVFAAISGIGTAGTGRLRGVVPPMNPNELGLLSSVCFLWLFVKMLTARERWYEILAALSFAGVTLLTGSRAGLAALCAAILVMTLRVRSLTRGSFVVVALLGPAMVYVLLGTDVISSVLLRGGERGVTTLSNRTIAWDAALTSGRDPLQAWFGEGLAQKQIQVPGQWWNIQLLDSSWISALVQGGLIGLALTVWLSLTTVTRSALRRDYAATLWLGLIAFLVTRGFLESGLFDSSASFMALCMATLGARRIPLLRDSSLTRRSSQGHVNPMTPATTSATAAR